MYSKSCLQRKVKPSSLYKQNHLSKLPSLLVFRPPNKHFHCIIQNKAVVLIYDL